MKIIQKVPIYVFMFSLFPILALFNHNIYHLNFFLIFRSLVASIIFGAIFLVIAKLVVKNWRHAGQVTSLGLALLFSYFPVFQLLRVQFNPQSMGQLLFFSFIGLFIMANQYLIHKWGNNNKVTLILTIAGITLLLIPISQSAYSWFSTSRANEEAYKLTRDLLPVAEDIDQQAQMPDIYYFVLDAYTNAATLDEFGGFDNAPFLQELSNLGFYISPCSQSNYSTSYHSLRSSFYMDYLDNLIYRGTTLPSMENSTLLQSLKLLGYKVVTFENSAEGQFSLNEDIRLSRNYSLVKGLSFANGLNGFEFQLIGAYYFAMPIFGFPALSSLIPILQDPLRSVNKEHYLQTMFILDSLPNIQSIESPKLVIAHIVVPHYPFVFSPSGRFTHGETVDNKTGYLENVEFINNRLLPILSSIIEQSEIPPIILIQGDHGPAGYTPEQRMAILNAYYVDNEVENQLYPSISPVNSFRLISNHYFGTNLPLLEDISYYLGEDFRHENEFLDATIIDNSCEEVGK